jgi:hypothetical protein
MPVRGPTPADVTQLEIGSSNPFLTEEEKQILEQKKKAVDKLLSDQGLAKYKIELMLGKDWVPSKPSPGIMSFWESGKKFHGGGDTIMHICPKCEAFIPDEGHGYGQLICGSCGSVWEGEEVHGQIAARLDAKGWTQAILKYLYRLDMNADIRIKYHPTDIRSAALREQESQRMGEDLGRARSKRAVRIYTMRAIIKDTSAGASLTSCILGFVRA